MKHPFSINSFGGVNYSYENSKEFYDQAIYVAMKVNPGQLVLDPNFGTEDPTFDAGEPIGLRATLTNFWPEIAVTSITAGNANKDGTRSINVDYEVEDAIS